MEWYKISVEFEDEVNETICDAYYKGFKKCKRKLAQAFYHPDLKDIITDEPEKIEEERVTSALGDTTKAIEVAKLEVSLEPPQASPPAIVARVMS